jgi:arylsulfatase A-like enzyme
MEHHAAGLLIFATLWDCWIMNVIWITADTFRKDHLGCYGNDRIQTPSLDAFANKAVRFDRHYAAAFPTMPARADFYTGRWTGTSMGWEPIPMHQKTLPQLLRKNFHTAAVVDTPFYTRNSMNYDMGFRSFIEVPGQLGALGYVSDERSAWQKESDRFAPQTFTRAAEWLELHHKEDFFLYVDAWDPHEPWDAPDHYTERYWPGYDGERIDPPYAHWQDVPGMTEETVRKAHACYCGEITMVDTWFGHFLRQVENMGLMDNTVIVFTTDHGFYFGEHGGLFGKTFGYPKTTAKLTPRYQDDEENWLWGRSPLFEELIACPLMVYSPEIAAGSYSGLTSAIDIMPTVLDAMGQNIPDFVQGESLLPRMGNDSLAGREFVISTQPFSKPGQISRQVDGRERLMVKESSTTITTDEWSLLYSSEPGESWLYHLPSDPGQENNIANEKPEIARQLHQHLVNFLREFDVDPELQAARAELKL